MTRLNEYFRRSGLITLMKFKYLKSTLVLLKIPPTPPHFLSIKLPFGRFSFVDHFEQFPCYSLQPNFFNHFLNEIMATNHVTYKDEREHD